MALLVPLILFSMHAMQSVIREHARVIYKQDRKYEARASSDFLTVTIHDMAYPKNLGTVV